MCETERHSFRYFESFPLLVSSHTESSTNLLKQTIQVDMDCVTREPVEENILPVTVPEAKVSEIRKYGTYPSTYPIIDMTASVLA